MGFLSNLFGSGSGAYEQNIDMLEADKKEARDYYTRKANEDYSQSSEAQAALKNARDVLEARYKQAAGAAVVSGSTDESVALQKEVNNQALSDATSRIAANGTSLRNRAMDGYLGATRDYDNAIAGQRTSKAQSEAKAAGDLFGSTLGLLSPVKAIGK